MRQPETLEAVQARIRTAWQTRRGCGLFASAAGLRVGRLIALRDAGHGEPAALLRQALEAEAVALAYAPVPRRAGL
ncbi:hypothetical protein [Methylorubrum extorquens]|uniref:hypothetical protein n=1 Tax=Methylorubrum extorquens TaxID=408 RepID=UPI001EE57EA8|nr:hypothetical protein [Methylorubrum extorquens]MCG5249520.1 hypothetical protein [Methylorubrum extorquens]